jgi:DNA-binding response OmpR family regulator
LSRDRPLVVVADDDRDILQLVALRLERADYEVVQASDGQQALQLVTELRPDLAVLDVMMPKLNGYEVTREIRRGEETQFIPVILLTARVQEVDVAHAFEAGADDYVEKPFSPEELRARVQAILALRAERSTEDPPAEPEPAAAGSAS